MSTIARRVQRPLTNTELGAVILAIDVAETPIEAVVSALRVTYNLLLAEFGETWDDYDSERRLDPKLYAIPGGQWRLLGEKMMERCTAIGQQDDGVQVTLTWMNIGPGSYEEDQ